MRRKHGGGLISVKRRARSKRLWARHGCHGFRLFNWRMSDAIRQMTWTDEEIELNP